MTVTFWEFVDKHIIFSFLMGSGILIVIDSMHTNWINTRGRK